MRENLLPLVSAAIAAWLLIGALGLVRPHHLTFVSRVLFPAGSAVALALAIVALLAIGGNAADD